MALLDDGRVVTRDLAERLIQEELTRIREEVGSQRFEHGRFDRARELFEQVSMSEELEDFLTVPAYEELVKEP